MNLVRYLLHLSTNSLEPLALSVVVSASINSVGYPSSTVPYFVRYSRPSFGSSSTFDQHVKDFKIDFHRDVLRKQRSQFSFSINRLISREILCKFWSPLSLQFTSLSNDSFRLQFDVQLRDRNCSSRIIFEVTSLVVNRLLLEDNRSGQSCRSLSCLSYYEAYSITDYSGQFRVSSDVCASSILKSESTNAFSIKSFSCQANTEYVECRRCNTILISNRCRVSSLTSYLSYRRSLVDRISKLTSAIKTASYFFVNKHLVITKRYVTVHAIAYSSTIYRSSVLKV